MSTLAAARADNFYYDPERFDPSKRGRDKPNALANSHGALGKRAARLHEGILVIRFEMPHDSWCLGCGEHIARGVRFNADKSRDGAYYSTPIWKFVMHCPLCPQQFVIRTDPAGDDYEYVSGVRRKEKRFEPEAIGMPKSKSEQAAAAIATDAVYRMEHKLEDQRRAASATERLTAITQQQDVRWKDDYAANQAVRRIARAARATSAQQVAEGAARGLDMPLLPATLEDAAVASAIMSAQAVERAVPAAGPATMTTAAGHLGTAMLAATRAGAREVGVLASGQGGQAARRVDAAVTARGTAVTGSASGSDRAGQRHTVTAGFLSGQWMGGAGTTVPLHRQAAILGGSIFGSSRQPHEATASREAKPASGQAAPHRLAMQAATHRHPAAPLQRTAPPILAGPANKRPRQGTS
jgi:hypothetical protein